MTNYDYLYDKDYYREAMNQKYLVNKKLGCEIISNGIILPYKDIPGLWCGGGGY